MIRAFSSLPGPLRSRQAGDWSDQQNDAIVADYFAMLSGDIAGRPNSKAERNRRELQGALPDLRTTQASR